jgi:hypothetical protein
VLIFPIDERFLSIYIEATFILFINKAHSEDIKILSLKEMVYTVEKNIKNSPLDRDKKNGIKVTKFQLEKDCETETSKTLARFAKGSKAWLVFFFF